MQNPYLPGRVRRDNRLVPVAERAKSDRLRTKIAHCAVLHSFTIDVDKVWCNLETAAKT